MKAKIRGCVRDDERFRKHVAGSCRCVSSDKGGVLGVCLKGVLEVC